MRVKPQPGRQFAARGALATAQHPALGEIKMPAVVPRLSEASGEIESQGRGFGADTEEVLACSLNYAPARIDRLRARHHRDGDVFR